ncbi:hypothetical protein QZH41_000590 [Actinostola sp. cb2023]|nr:hypothetical protein QZH41_000590 [Actinostola sp. cb2023]
MQCANAKDDDDMIRILLGVKNDLVAAEARYHKTCYASYTSLSNLKWQCLPEDEKKESAYDQAFQELVSEIEIGIKAWKAFDMSSLLNKYIGLLEKQGVDGHKYKTQNLKFRIKNHFGERIVFQQPYRRDISELVYSSEISLMDVINGAAAQRNDQPELLQKENSESAESVVYKAAKMLKGSIKECNSISLYPLSSNDIELERAKSLVPPDLYLFLRWLITSDDLDARFDSPCSNVSDERRVLCLAQDMVHCLSHGRIKLPKHVGLAMAVRHITGSKEIVTILNRLGHCSSYDEIERVDTGLAKEILAKSRSVNVMIPSNIIPGNFVQFASDNNDINEETLDGKNTTHATTVVVYQRKVFGPMPPPPEALADHTQRKRSLGNTADHNEILECSAYGRRPTVTTFLGQMGNEPFMSTTPEYRLSCNMDVTWALSRIPSSKLFETDQAREEADPVVPNWSAFNSLVFMKTSLPSVIGYCPMINGASTELSTVYTVLKKAQRMCAHLNQRDMVITFDLAIYSKAKQIQFKFPEEFKDTIVRMGGFHIALNFIAVIGKRYQNSGLEDILIESGAYGPNSVTSLMKGKSYNRGVRAHKLMMEALFRLRWQAFVRWLNKTTQESLRSSLDEQHVIKRMETFQMAINNKENVSQNLESMVTELKPLMEQFEAFRQEQKSKSKMFAFWDEYICMVIILLQFIKAERSADWSLHLAATTAMVPYFYAHDRPNYSRWLPVYLADMAQLEQKHPEVYRQFMEGEHAVSRSSQPFAKVWTDMALEQSINLDSKSKGGIVGISQNPAALQRWFITSHERAAITTAVKKMCALNDSDRVGTHKEAGHNRAQRDEKDVRGIVSCFTEGQMKDPFLEDNDSLSNITTGVVLPPEVAEKLVKSAEQGLVQMKGFIQARLNANTISFWEPIPSLKVKTFNITAKKASVKTSREKLVAIAEDRDLFGRLLIVARVRQIDLREILSYELSAVPYSLAHSDGTLRKTTKSVLLHNLEGDVTVEPSLPPSTTLPTSHIVDGMALIHTIKFAGASTFGELAAKYYEIITSYYRQGNCSRIDLVFDQYWDLSIKAGERQRRGEVTALEVQIHGLSTPVPKQ